MSIYLRVVEKAEGPFTIADIQSRLDQGRITTETAAWCVGWPEWKTVAEVLQPQAPANATQADNASPLPPPAEVEPAPTRYAPTLVLASILFLWDAIFAGQGALSMFVLILGTPVLAIRALLTRKQRRLFRRRLASIGIYALTAIIVVVLVRTDQKGAMRRAGEVIAACEAHKKATGGYPKALSNLVPQYLPAIPPARKLGMSGGQDFQYIQTGQNGSTSDTNSHLLIYVAIPPFGKKCYVFEEGKWTFYD